MSEIAKSITIIAISEHAQETLYNLYLMAFLDKRRAFDKTKTTSL